MPDGVLYTVVVDVVFTVQHVAAKPGKNDLGIDDDSLFNKRNQANSIIFVIDYISKT